MYDHDEPDTSAEKRERERLRRARNRVGVSSLPHDQRVREHWALNGMIGGMRTQLARRRFEDS